MATYVIGDLQGCFDALQRLLCHVNYQPEHDKLWFCGDLVARGPQSLQCLQFVKSLGEAAVTVLGNHDLHLLACYYGVSEIKKQDLLQPVFESPELESIVNWLRQQPLLHVSADQRFMMVHAGLAPAWSLQQAITMTQEVQTQLKTDPLPILQNMYGNKPEHFHDATTEQLRWRFTINSCTRIRFCRQDGSLELKEKGHPRNQEQLVPWYEFWRNKLQAELFFGHWAALNGYSPIINIHALDTGCIWGNALTAYCIETQQRYSVAGLARTRYI
ncbi:symmetrical bis(5'-nucleosyl)-tetraphosphatase [Rheinheimera baltica]|uniref:symmetrical bis(5'-nucleosyl)-tetraphosphatase n=1 Tax=Rheinheimera baltica TaxID=67576 RepID=UPI00273E750D|nr:symmetrical bis(5'-nucleosyl)-tetraphosphatase [Rheinheimera baltica]MDP5142517.1 symmetrical bis(5'-nucleosyl)-tetraphosphatase [Rheinheimera baltica]MDP5150390.1 symmetrical bis(5'-nucleosyl)-tetraphosphatase [Rheinheimera baltica]